MMAIANNYERHIYQPSFAIILPFLWGKHNTLKQQREEVQHDQHVHMRTGGAAVRRENADGVGLDPQEETPGY